MLRKQLERSMPVLLRRGWQDGVQEGNRFWLGLGALAAAVRVVRWLNARDRSEHVLTETLRPGDALLISDGGDPVVVRRREPRA